MSRIATESTRISQDSVNNHDDSKIDNSPATIDTKYGLRISRYSTGLPTDPDQFPLKINPKMEHPGHISSSGSGQSAVNETMLFLSGSFILVEDIRLVSEISKSLFSSSYSILLGYSHMFRKNKFLAYFYSLNVFREAVVTSQIFKPSTYFASAAFGQEYEIDSHEISYTYLVSNEIRDFNINSLSHSVTVIYSLHWKSIILSGGLLFSLEPDLLRPGISMSLIVDN